MKVKVPQENGAFFMDGVEYPIRNHMLEIHEKYASFFIDKGYKIYVTDGGSGESPEYSNKLYINQQYNLATSERSRTLRVGIWQLTTTHYSGGRILIYQFAHTLASFGAEVWLITNLQPMWSDNYPKIPKLYVIIEGKDKIPNDLDLIVTDSKDDIGRKAFEYWNKGNRKLKFICWNFETSNWVREFAPQVADRYGDDRWKSVFNEAELLISCSRMGNVYLSKWLDKDIKCGVVNPYVNIYALNDMEKSNLVLPKRPYAVWSARGSEYKGGEVAYKSILAIPQPFDLICFGQPTGWMKNTDIHTIYKFGNYSDIDKFKALSYAQFTLAPSWFEGFGMVPSESLASGTPVIAYDLPVLREQYGDRLTYVPHRNDELYIKKVVEMSALPKISDKDNKKFVINTYGPQHMAEQIERLPYFSLISKNVSVQIICWWGKTICEALESIYPYVKEIIIAHGPTKLVSEIDNEPDGSLELIRNFPDPDRKIILESRKVWKDKAEMRTWCSSKITGNYLLVLDADEIWIGLDRWLTQNIDFCPPRWINFWKTPKTWICDSSPRQRHWGIALDNYGSLCHHYRWSWWRHSYRWQHHSMLHDVSGLPVMDVTYGGGYNRIRSIKDTMIYHLNNLLPKSVMDRKLLYYKNRDGDRYHVETQKKLWNDWNGRLGKYGDDIIKEITWELPEIVNKAISKMVA